MRPITVMAIMTLVSRASSGQVHFIDEFHQTQIISRLLLRQAVGALGVQLLTSMGMP